jgi:hypothetical protein
MALQTGQTQDRSSDTVSIQVGIQVFRFYKVRLVR